MIKKTYLFIFIIYNDYIKSVLISIINNDRFIIIHINIRVINKKVNIINNIKISIFSY